MKLLTALLLFTFLLLNSYLFAQDKIPFSALPADNEGIFGVGAGSLLPNNLCAPPGVNSPYHVNLTIKSADMQNTYPGYVSAGHFRGDILGGVEGFPQFMNVIAVEQLDLTKIHIRFTEMTQDLLNWQFIDGVDTRMYTGGQFSLVYIDGPSVETIVSGDNPRLRDVINYHAIGNCFDDQIYGDTEYFIPSYAAGNSTLEIQNLANAFIADIENKGIKLQFNSIQPAIVGFWSVGAVYSILNGVIVKGVIPIIDLDLEQPAGGQDNQCSSAEGALLSTGSGNWLEFVDENGKLIVAVHDSENMGEISVSFYKNAGEIRESGNGIELLDRNIQITPTQQPVNEVKVRLYFSTADWDALVGANDDDENDITTFDQLTISKYSSTCSADIGTGGLLVSADEWGYLGTNANGGYFLDVTVTEFSSFFFHGNSPVAALPIEWIDFTAKYTADMVQLAWSTASEFNNAGFEIQRSFDGHDFEKTAWIAGKGESQRNQFYYYEDEEMQYDLAYYYRLMQVDFDGKTSFSPIRFIQTPSVKEHIFKCFPNPAKEEVTIMYDVKTINRPNLYLYDSFGKLVQKQALNKATTNIDISLLENGVYFVALYDGHQRLLGSVTLLKD